MDPLELLPVEIILRIIEISPISTVAALTRVTRSWHNFIEEAHQKAIYSSPSKTSWPHARRDLSFLAEAQSFTKYFEDITSWKELCRRQTLLNRNWNDREPVTRESIFQAGNASHAVWRFRVDWKRRLIISTSGQRGFYVTDLDTGVPLWRLGLDRVQPYAHLEYEDGIAVFDCVNNGLDIWKTDIHDLPRGSFQRTATLPHDCVIRGLQLSYGTLCVVSTQGQGFVYDMSLDPPLLKTHLEIEKDANGHLYQDPEVVMYSMGTKGYHIHDKESGTLVVVLNPAGCQTFYRIVHPNVLQDPPFTAEVSCPPIPSLGVFPPRNPMRGRLYPIDIQDGRLDETTDRTRISLESDEWGAGILSESMMVGISRGGRMFVCSNWREAVRNPKSIETNSYIIECNANVSNHHFNIGGWLSVRDHRALFECRYGVYVISLERNGVQHIKGSQHIRPSHFFKTCSHTDLAAPVSFMAIYDDCIMSTHTTHRERRGEILVTKTIHVLSLAPRIDSEDEEHVESLVAPEQYIHASNFDIVDQLLSDEEDD